MDRLFFLGNVWVLISRPLISRKSARPRARLCPRLTPWMKTGGHRRTPRRWRCAAPSAPCHRQQRAGADADVGLRPHRTGKHRQTPDPGPTGRPPEPQPPQTPPPPATADHRNRPRPTTTTPDPTPTTSHHTRHLSTTSTKHPNLSTTLTTSTTYHAINTSHHHREIRPR